MLKDACDKKFDILLVKSLSRFGRNNRETLNNLNELYKNNVRAIFIEENLDTEKDRSMVGLFSWLSEQESRKISDRQKFTKAQMKSKKLFPYNNRPYGYKLVDHILVPIPEEAERVQLIYNLYLKGYGINKIANYLDSNNIPPRRSKNWSKNALKVILTNPHYTGNLYYNKSYKVDTMDEKPIYTSPEEWIEVKNTHEAIISEDLFMRVKEENKKRYEKTQSNTRYSTTNIFSNLVRCGRCNSTYIRKKLHNGSKYVYSCANYESNGKKCCTREAIDENDLIQIVHDNICVISENEDLLNELYNKSLKEISIDIDYLQNELKDMNIQILKLKNKADKLLDLYTEELITKEQFKDQNTDINNKLESLFAKQEELNSRIKQKDSLDDTFKIFKERLCELKNIAIWTNDLLKDYISSITVYDKNSISIDLLIYKDIDVSMFQDSAVQKYVQHQSGTLIATLNINNKRLNLAV
jgi:site-specific DNA recombinase